MSVFPKMSDFCCKIHTQLKTVYRLLSTDDILTKEEKHKCYQ